MLKDALQWALSLKSATSCKLAFVLIPIASLRAATLRVTDAPAAIAAQQVDRRAIRSLKSRSADLGKCSLEYSQQIGCRCRTQLHPELYSPARTRKLQKLIGSSSCAVAYTSSSNKFDRDIVPTESVNHPAGKPLPFFLTHCGFDQLNVERPFR